MTCREIHGWKKDPDVQGDHCMVPVTCEEEIARLRGMLSDAEELLVSYRRSSGVGHPFYVDTPGAGY